MYLCINSWASHFRSYLIFLITSEGVFHSIGPSYANANNVQQH